MSYDPCAIKLHIGGKSAVLTALTIALGGKATSTGRGHGLKSFIREGQQCVFQSFFCVFPSVYSVMFRVSTAEVTVGLKNQGDEAYRPDVYGERVFITRRFSKDGSSNYKIKSSDGKTVSTKREELTAICDHMNIQVDNPMNVLTQGNASFLIIILTIMILIHHIIKTWLGSSLAVLLRRKNTR